MGFKLRRPAIYAGLALLVVAGYNACSQSLQIISLSSIAVPLDDSLMPPLQSAANPFAESCDPAQLGSPTTFERLSARELRNTLTDLLGSTLSASELNSALTKMPVEGLSKLREFDTKDAPLGMAVIEGSFEAFEVISQIVSATGAKRSALSGQSCLNSDSINDACLNDFLAKFGTRAFRRPLTSEEKTIFLNLYNGAGGQSTADRFSLVVQALLLSPSFFFHMEDQGEVLENGKLKLSSYEVASRLSYTLLGTMPDAQLFDLAAKNQLSDPATLKQQVERLSQDARAKAMLNTFVRQWLRIEDRRLNYSSYYAGSTVPSAADLSQELESFVNDVVWGQNGDYEMLMSSSTAFVRTPAMAQIYGVSQPGGEGRVQLDPTTRGGLLTRAGYLASGFNGTSPIQRGLRVRLQVLCEALGLPSGTTLPPDPSVDPNEVPKWSTRDKVAYSTRADNCQACHKSINGTGFTFEQFDGLGRLRTQEKVFDGNGILIATQPVVMGQDPIRVSAGEAARSYHSVSDFSRAISTSTVGPACLAIRYFQFSRRRAPKEQDNCSLAYMYEALKGQDGSILKLIELTAQDPRLRIKIAQ